MSSSDGFRKQTESPRKVTHLTVTKQLSKGGGDSFDVDEYASETYNFQERRGSSQSISRYNSCPQLADTDASVEETYEKTVDDINTNAGALHREMKCVIIQSPSPLLQKKIYLENGQISDTPTPPSTPKSRRSIMSSRDSLLSSPDKTFIGSPFTSPRLLLRKQIAQSALSRDSSFDSLADKTVDKRMPLSAENLQRFDDEDTKKSRLTDPKYPNAGGGYTSASPEVTDTLHKCENWLQTLNIAQTDRIKSRSHIQLPPI